MATDVPPPVASTRWWSPARICQLVAVVLAVGTGLLVGFGPLGQESTTTITSNGVVTTEQHSTSLADQLGRGVLFIIVVPVLVTLLPLLFSGTTHVIVSWVAAALMGLGMLAGAFTIGIFYAPLVILLGVAALLATIRRVNAGSASAG
jgi:hypothetical protein